MAERRTAAIFGATGLVGRACLDLLLADERYVRIVAIGRREPAQSHPKLVVRRAALDIVEALDDPTLGSVDDVFCCLGTTIRKAGSQEAFRRVDLDYVVNAASFAKRHGARHFLMVSAVGADARSRVFYSRVKGEVEGAIAKLGIERVSIFRPSFILGPRKESRLGERLGMAVGGCPLVRHGRPVDEISPNRGRNDRAGNACRGSDAAPGVTVYDFNRMATLGGNYSAAAGLK
jgi:uncharacterized protein YbjT (DUF2867 family)